MDIMHQYVAGIVEVTQRYKQSLFTEHGERDMPPRMAVIQAETETLVPIPDEILVGLYEQCRSIAGVIEAIFGSFRKHDPEVIDQIERFVLALDGYQRVGGDIPEKGEMEEDFKSNPFTDVTEVLQVVVASDDRCGGCDIIRGSSTYKLDDGGTFIFDDIEFQEGDDLTGDVPNALRRNFRKESLS